jgi:DNA-directed RNA polymerase specialized sigma24 family protein
MEATDGGGRRRRMKMVEPAGRRPEGESFDRLLDWLDHDRDRAAEAYERIREKLTKFFDWRGAFEAEDLADRTIDRVSRKLSESAVREDSDATSFFYGVARNILKEHRTEGARRFSALRELSRAGTEEAGRPEDEAEADPLNRDAGPGDVSSPALRFECLDRCLAELSSEDRSLILAYYQGDKREKIENRKGLAARLGIPMNALWIRTHRVRLKLEGCMGRCVREAAPKGMSRDSH